MKKSWLHTIFCVYVLFTPGLSFLMGGEPSITIMAPDPRYDFDVKFYKLNLEVSDSSTYIRGSVSILIEPLVPLLDQVVLDFSGSLTADSVTVNGQKLSYVHNADVLNITLPYSYTIGSPHFIEVHYHGLGKSAVDYSGIYNQYLATWDKRVTWTLSEPFYAKNWFPCKQVLTDKADSAYVFLSTDDNLKAGSNGILTAQVPLPGNRIRYEWKSRHPIDYYLISFAVSDYQDYSYYVRTPTGTDSILVQNYIYNHADFLGQNKEAIDKTADLIVLYSDLFGMYPYQDEKYGHCIAPLGGGMEHQTMTTLSNFSFLLVAHELAHQWFGDYVTCSTWSDIWINEGFASYGEYLANQYLISQSMADYWITGVHDFVKSVPGGSIYVPPKDIQDVGRIFDYRLTYRKGAAIIHMIRYMVDNDSLFFHTLRTFLGKYKNGQASGLDFRDHLEEVTGKDFHDFFDQWYFGEGFPIHSFNWNQENDTLFINSLQTTSSGTPLFTLPIEFKIKVNDQDTLLTFNQTNNFNSWKICLPGTVSSVVVDPNHWLMLDVTDVHHTGISEQETEFSVVPNPAKEQINIYYTGQADSYTIYLADAAGKILYSGQSFNNSYSIDISHYAAGLYFVIIKDLGFIRQAKFIVY